MGGQLGFAGSPLPCLLFAFLADRSRLCDSLASVYRLSVCDVMYCG